MKTILFFSALFAVLPLHAETLQSQLDAKRRDFTAKAPPERVAAYEAGIDAVSASGIYQRAKKTGDRAPDFTLKNSAGQDVRLADLLAKGPVVLTWYRGGWCPYCNLALAALQKELPAMQALGATLVALTPELPEHAEDTTKKGSLAFEVLSDVGNRVAREFGVVFKMTPDVAAAMRSGAKTNVRNGDDSDELPLGAAYVIAPNGEITYAFLDADYRRRVEPARLVDALEALRTGKPTPEHLLLSFWEGVWNPPYDLGLVDRLMTEDFVITSAGEDTVGREQFKEWIRKFQAKFGEMRLENREIFTGMEGKRVVSRWLATGKNRGLFNLPATGQPVEFTGLAVWEVRGNRLAHNWVERSAYELYRRLTAEPAAEVRK